MYFVFSIYNVKLLSSHYIDIIRSDEARRLKHAWLYEAEQKHAETTQQVLQLEGGNQPLAITDGSQVCSV